MPATSEVILNSQTHSGLNLDPTTVTGDKFKGDGYYGWGDGVHTVEIELTVFVGNIALEATLATDPTEDDWFRVPLTADSYYIDTSGALVKLTAPSAIEYTAPTTSAKIYNFTGNFVWIRAVVDNWTAGSINRVLFNH